MGGDEVLLRHDFVDGTVKTAFETQVAIGDDAHQMLLVVDHGNTADVILRHDVERLSHRATAGNGHGVVDHTVLSTLDNSHLAGLVLDRHILVDNADTTFAGNGNGHLALGDGVHGGRHEGHVELDVA